QAKGQGHGAKRPTAPRALPFAPGPLRFATPMVFDPTGSIQSETAHVLFMDIVGYSDEEMPVQRRLLEELQELVRGTGEFRRAEGAHELLRLPTGDGMALVFFRDPVTPLQCAMQLSRALRERPHLRVRLGLHTGPAYRV